MPQRVVSLVAVLCLCIGGIAHAQVGMKAQAAAQPLPITFEPLVGGRGNTGAFLGRAAGTEVLFESGKVTLAPAKAEGAALVITFDHAGKASAVGELLQPSHTNYLIGSDPSRWRVGVSNFARIRYPQLYPGVDVVFYGNEQSLEHDFLLSPGADARSIGLRFAADALAISPDGELQIRAGSDTLVLKRPLAYQWSRGGKRDMVAAEFNLRGKGVVGFRVGEYDHRRPLVIDPVLVFSTYVSTVASGGGYVGVDAAGDTYISGNSSSSFPVTAGAYTSCSGCGAQSTVSVSKLSPDGTKLLWSTVLGGNNSAQPTGLAVDAKGNALVSGFTSATNFPTQNGLSTTGQNTGGGFLFSLTADGSALNFSTMLPGADYALAVATDTQGDAFVTGVCGSGYITTAGALTNGSTVLNRPEFDVFLTKFSTTGSLIYSAILGTADLVFGGSGPIGPSAVSVDSAGNAYVAGRAGSLWPTTAGAYSLTIPGSMPAAEPFVAKVAPNGASLVYSTYLGDGGAVQGVIVRSDGSVLVGGSAPGPTFPTTSAPYEQNNGKNGGYLVQLNPSGSALVYSTVLFDSTFSMGGFATGPDGSLWVGGRTESSSFPTVNPLQGTYTGSTPGLSVEPVVAQFDPTFKNLTFSTYLSGSAGVGYAQSVAVDQQGYVHVGGAVAYGLNTTPGAAVAAVPQPAPAYAGNTFPFVAVINAALPGPALCAAPDDQIRFGPVPVSGYAEQPLKISSCGTQPLTVSGVTSGAAAFTVPASENSCTQSLPPGQSCTVTVRYSPTAVQSDVSTLTIASNAATTTQIVALNGNGILAPFFTATPSSVPFSPQLVGTTAAAQMISLTNTGSAAATNLIIQLLQAGSTFQETTTCGSSLAQGASCTISISFNPTSAGAATATLNVLDTVDLPFFNGNYAISGTGAQAGFSLAPTQSGGSAATVSAGQTASYSLNFASVGGYAGTVTFACGTLPQNATCGVHPATLPAAGSGSQTVTVSIGTQVTQTARVKRMLGSGELLVAFGVPLLLRRRRRLASLCTLLLVSLSLVTGCGGSGDSSGGGGAPKVATVAPGTYSVQVTASDGKNTQSQTLTLTVQ